MLRHARFSLGTFALAAGEALAPTPLSPQQERAFTPLYDRFLESLAEDTVAATQTRQSFGWEGDVFIDLSSAAAYDAIVKDGAIRIEFSSPPSGLTASACTLAPSAPQ